MELELSCLTFDPRFDFYSISLKQQQHQRQLCVAQV